MIPAQAAFPQEGAGSPASARPQVPENEELRWMQEHENTSRQDAGSRNAGTMPAKKPLRKRVQRKTCLRGQSIDPPHYPKQSVMRQIEKDFGEKDPDIPYIAWENAMKDLVCSLIERQDRLARNLLLRLGDLEYRVEDLENDMDEHLNKTGKEEGKVTG